MVQQCSASGLHPRKVEELRASVNLVFCASKVLPNHPRDLTLRRPFATIRMALPQPRAGGIFFRLGSAAPPQCLDPEREIAKEVLGTGTMHTVTVKMFSFPQSRAEKIFAGGGRLWEKLLNTCHIGQWGGKLRGHLQKHS